MKDEAHRLVGWLVSWFKAVALSGNTWLGRHGCYRSRCSRAVKILKSTVLHMSQQCSPRLNEVQGLFCKTENVYLKSRRPEELQR